MGQGLTLVGCGDSWAWGTELIDRTEITDNTWSFDLHWTPSNVKYREDHRYLKLFADKIGATSIVDISRGGTSNDSIVRKLFRWLSENGYLAGRDTSDIFVSIGWTSPERKDFCYNQERPGWEGGWFTMYPMWNHDYNITDLNQFRDIYIQHLWSAEEYLHRWIMQVWQTQLLLKTLGIKHVMHQAFYHHHKSKFIEWSDKRYKELVDHNSNLSDLKIWESVDNITFMHKDDPNKGTFYSYIKNISINTGTKVFYENHPNEFGHQLWADYMYKYCLENNLL
jgi:hypothetical protein